MTKSYSFQRWLLHTIAFWVQSELNGGEEKLRPHSKTKYLNFDLSWIKSSIKAWQFAFSTGQKGGLAWIFSFNWLSEVL